MIGGFIQSALGSQFLYDILTSSGRVIEDIMTTGGHQGLLAMVGFLTIFLNRKWNDNKNIVCIILVENDTLTAEYSIWLCYVDPYYRHIQ